MLLDPLGRGCGVEGKQLGYEVQCAWPRRCVGGQLSRYLRRYGRAGGWGQLGWRFVLTGRGWAGERPFHGAVDGGTENFVERVALTALGAQVIGAGGQAEGVTVARRDSVGRPQPIFPPVVAVGR
ncbi:MAG: hypothetical protein H8E35_05820 [Ardenticatenia bacterium]|nr:hypothetical protein [Ardenticatenia bacterium]